MEELVKMNLKLREDTEDNKRKIIKGEIEINKKKEERSRIPIQPIRKQIKPAVYRRWGEYEN